MNLKIQDTIVLDDNREYAVASIAEYENETYYYFVDINNFPNLRYAKYNKETGGFVDIEDPLIINELLPRFVLAAKDVIMDLSKNTEN